MLKKHDRGCLCRVERFKIPRHGDRYAVAGSLTVYSMSFAADDHYAFIEKLRTLKTTFSAMRISQKHLVESMCRSTLAH